MLDLHFDEVMNDEQMKANAWKLFHALAFEPKERDEEPVSYVDKPKSGKKTANWEYEFAFSDLRSESLLIGFCKRHKLGYKKCQRGILVHQISNTEINDARKKCNKTNKQFAIKL